MADKHGKHEDAKGQHKGPLTGRAGASPRGKADKAPWPERPPKGWGGATGGAAGKHGPKGVKP